MIPALVNGKLERATLGARGACPECGDAVYARIPEHAIRHWAHNPLPDGQLRDCAMDTGEETEWHKAWKNTRTDVACIEFSREPHSPRTDVLTPGGYAVEFQHSSIKPEVIARREQYWGKGIWVLDGTPDDDGERRVSFRRRPDQDPSDSWRIFVWPRAPRILSLAKWPIWIDTGDELVQLQTMIPDASPRQGRGWTVTRTWFIDEVINGTRAIFRTHRVPSSKPQPKREGQARAESDDDLKVIPVCNRTPEPGPTPVVVADTIGATLRTIASPSQPVLPPRSRFVPEALGRPAQTSVTPRTPRRIRQPEFSPTFAPGRYCLKTCYCGQCPNYESPWEA